MNEHQEPKELETPAPTPARSADEEQIDTVAKEILSTFHLAFEELAK